MHSGLDQLLLQKEMETRRAAEPLAPETVYQLAYDETGSIEEAEKAMAQYVLKVITERSKRRNKRNED